MDWSAVKGFNYQPSYSSHEIEGWRRFDPVAVDREIARGRRYFPKANTLRLWLSWNAFIRGHNAFVEAFEELLAICDRHGFKAIPVLTNRWHDYGTDWGGIYFDHFLPGSSWVQSEGMWERYLEQVVGPHVDDGRIIAWDLCNEPFSYFIPHEEMPRVLIDAELAWLTKLHDVAKALGAKQPIGTSVHHNHGLKDLEMVEPISDVLFIHPYSNEGGVVDKAVALGKRVKKPVLATETCWGAVEDADRVKTIRDSLSMLKQHRVGWIAHLLHHSLVSDGHRPQFGSVDRPGFHFIEADGALRPGHDAFNDY